jgi:hypothetical protein
MLGAPDFTNGSIEGRLGDLLRLINATPREVVAFFDSSRRREIPAAMLRSDGSGSRRRPLLTPRIRRHQADLRALVNGLFDAGVFGERVDSERARVHVNGLNARLLHFGAGALQLTLLGARMRGGERGVVSLRPRKPEWSWEGDHFLALAQAVGAGVQIARCERAGCQMLFVPREIAKGPIRRFCSDKCRRDHNNARVAVKESKRLNAKLKRGAGAYQRKNRRSSTPPDTRSKSRK